MFVVILFNQIWAILFSWKKEKKNQMPFPFQKAFLFIREVRSVILPCSPWEIFLWMFWSFDCWVSAAQSWPHGGGLDYFADFLPAVEGSHVD